MNADEHDIPHSASETPHFNCESEHNTTDDSRIKPDSTHIHHDLDHLAGTWSAEEAEHFLAAIADMRQCDEGLLKRT